MADAETSNKPARRALLGEAVLLAISPVAAYIIAFAFETGYAERIGYPSWVIEISPANVALAWAALATGLMTVAMLFFVLSMIPLSVVRALFSRPAFMIVMSFAAPVVLWSGVSANAFELWFVGSMTLFLGLFASAELIWWRREYQWADRSLGFWDRLAAATKNASDGLEEIRARRRLESPRSLADHSERVRSSMAWIYLVGIAVYLLTGPARGWGYLRAGQGDSFLVSADSAQLVALRRFGSTLVAAEIDGQTIKAFRFLNSTDPTRRWVRRDIGRFQGLPVDSD
jgi:hypothetical protein